ANFLVKPNLEKSCKLFSKFATIEACRVWGLLRGKGALRKSAPFPLKKQLAILLNLQISII
ncbi:MAG: hypothetical protein IKI43_05610, partial [Campylobacter sp.]|nr:hypothetical protein [Campylobacter sp.]